MSVEEKEATIIKGLYDAVIDMDEEKTKELSELVIQEGFDAYRALTKGLAAAMDKVGELYSNQEYFVPELLLCSDALYAGMDVLKPHIKAEDDQGKLKIILGTVEGDIHDIGKNLTKIMFEAAGWEVYDLGADVKVGRFVEEHRKINADVIGLSALMTTSMLAMPKIIESIRAEDKDVTIIVGGAPLTNEIASNYGADGYAANAGEAVAAVRSILANSNN